jgi:hypothetical protein
VAINQTSRCTEHELRPLYQLQINKQKTKLNKSGTLDKYVINRTKLPNIKRTIENQSSDNEFKF